MIKFTLLLLNAHKTLHAYNMGTVAIEVLHMQALRTCQLSVLKAAHQNGVSALTKYLGMLREVGNFHLRL